MRRVLTLASGAAAIALAGCMTTEQALTGPPTLALVSPAPVSDVKACVLREAQGVSDVFKLPVPPPQAVEFDGVTKINFLNDPRIFVELRPGAAGGTDLRYVRHLRDLPPASRYDAVIRRCGG